MQSPKLPPLGREDAGPLTTYQVGGGNGGNHGGRQVYNLPSKTFLTAGADDQIDSWPAYASSNAVPGPVAALDKKSNLVIPSSKEIAPFPKPKFLDQLEKYLARELRALGCESRGPSEARLQVHREVFEYLIQDFKTYRPLLASIKNEYDLMLTHLRDKIRELEPFKQMLVTVSERCDQKVMALRDEERQEILELKQMNTALRKHIERLKEDEKALESNVERLQEEVSEQYKNYRKECDARKMLISDINDLRYQQEELLNQLSGTPQSKQEDGDPVFLKIALKKAREDLDRITWDLKTMEANYQDVIPRRDFESLEKRFNELSTSSEATAQSFDSLTEEHSRLVQAHADVCRQRDELNQECETLRRSATPRPDWNICFEMFTGSMDEWTEMIRGKTSAQLMEMVVNRCSGNDTSDTAEYFEGKGKGVEVPAYLRFEGKVRNRRLGRRDTALLIKDIWREKIAGGDEKKQMAMSDFAAEYLKEKFPIETMWIEWAYNLHDALGRLYRYPQIETFRRVVAGEMDEKIYHDFLKMVTGLLAELTKVETAEGTVSLDEIVTVIDNYFPYKTPEMIATLRSKIEEEMTALAEQTKNQMALNGAPPTGNSNGNVLPSTSGSVALLDEGASTTSAQPDVTVAAMSGVNYKMLFTEDDEGNAGPFMKELKLQDEQERKEYCGEIEKGLTVEEGEESVSEELLRSAIVAVDPRIDAENLNYFVGRGFIAEPFTVVNIVFNLMSGAVRRVGPRDAGLPDDSGATQMSAGAPSGAKTPKTPKSKASSAKHAND